MGLSTIILGRSVSQASKENKEICMGKEKSFYGSFGGKREKMGAGKEPYWVCTIVFFGVAKDEEEGCQACRVNSL
jgi:hypothetical protein